MRAIDFIDFGLGIRSTLLMAGLAAALSGGQAHASPAPTADDRASDLVRQMTPEEKDRIVHGIVAIPLLAGTIVPPDGVIGAGYVAGIPRLGLPSLRETDASLGVAYVLGLRKDGATALPSGLATAASFDIDAAYAGGAMAGHEAWLKGFNVLLGGGVNLARDPRNGRNFEYLGEDPLLAGTLAGAAIRGVQDQHVISTVKHFALNDQETLRNSLSAEIDEAGARESDLLAFEIAIREGNPGAVMCGYNRYGGAYACENDFLLNQVLKHDWRYRGWVMSDWGAVHSVSAALKGLDQESGEQLDSEVFFGLPLLELAQRDPAYAARLDDMDRRILRSILEIGLIDHQPHPGPLPLEADAAIARKGAEEGIVLLKNEGDILPLAAGVKRIAIIGGHADAGVLSGAGSSQVAPLGGPAVEESWGDDRPDALFRRAFYLPSPPLKAIRALAPRAEVRFDDGRYPSAAADLARRSDLVIIFATQWMVEGADAPDLSLPSGQDATIEAVAAANPNTIVVLETGGPVLMPWLDQVKGVVEAWYPGARGGEAIANVLFGEVAPSGRLPITFPASEAQLPRPRIPGADAPPGTKIAVNYLEGSDVGYRYFYKTSATPLFSFGFGLTYTSFSFSHLALSPAPHPFIDLDITNTGKRDGVAIPQIYLLHSPHRSQQRLLGWARVAIRAGETRRVRIQIHPRLLANWDQAAHGWRRDAGGYQIAAGSSSRQLGPPITVDLAAESITP